MNGDIRNYAKLGLVHHMLYPECMSDGKRHVHTMLEFVARHDIETFDCCLPGNGYSGQLIPAIRSCGKSVCFAIHAYPLRTEPLAAKTPQQRARTWALIDDMIGQAAAIGAEGFIFGAGIPSYHDATRADFEAFDRFCVELCTKLEPHGIVAMLEPFDMDVDKRFLYGPIDDCLALAKRVTVGHDNFGFELDVAHLPLMREDFTSAINRCAPYLRRVHLGNCVFADRRHPRWGDTHPPIGFPGGEIDVPELVVILRALLEVGFLNTQRRGNLLVEMTPWPGRSVDETVADSWHRLEAAWKRL